MKKLFIFILITILIVGALPIYADDDWGEDPPEEEPEDPPVNPPNPGGGGGGESDDGEDEDEYEPDPGGGGTIPNDPGDPGESISVSVDMSGVEDRLDKIYEEMERTREVEIKGVVTLYQNNQSSTASDYKVGEIPQDMDKINMYADIVEHGLQSHPPSAPEGHLAYLINNNVIHRDSYYYTNRKEDGKWNTGTKIDKDLYLDGSDIDKSTLLMSLVKNYEGVLAGGKVGNLFSDSDVDDDIIQNAIDYRKKELVGILGLDSAENDIMINWGRGERFLIYINPNIYSLYFAKAYQEGLLSQGDVREGTEVYDFIERSNDVKNLSYSWADKKELRLVRGLDKINGSIENDALKFKEVMEEYRSNMSGKDYSLTYGDRWVFNDDPDKAVGAGKDYDKAVEYRMDNSIPIFIEENMNNIDVLKLMEKFMRHYEKDMSLMEQKAIEYKLGAKANYMPEDRETITYMMAMGIIDFEDVTELNGYYNTATNSQILEWLYRLHNKEARDGFDIQLTDSEMTLAEMGMMEDSIEMGENAPVAYEEFQGTDKFPVKFIISYGLANGTEFNQAKGYKWYLTNKEHNLDPPGEEGKDYRIYSANGNYTYECTQEFYDTLNMSTGIYFNSKDPKDYPGIIIGNNGTTRPGTYKFGNLVDDLDVTSLQIPNTQTTEALVLGDESGRRIFKRYTNGGVNRFTYHVLPMSSISGKALNSYAKLDTWLEFSNSQSGQAIKVSENGGIYNNGKVQKSYSVMYRVHEPTALGVPAPLTTAEMKKLLASYDKSTPKEEKSNFSKALISLSGKNSTTETKAIRYGNAHLNLEKGYFIPETELKSLGIDKVNDKIFYNPGTDTYAFLLEEKDLAIVGNQYIETEDLMIDTGDDMRFYSLKILGKMLRPKEINRGYFHTSTNLDTLSKSWESPLNPTGNRVYQSVPNVIMAGTYYSMTHMTKVNNSIFIPLNTVEGLESKTGYIEIHLAWDDDVAKKKFYNLANKINSKEIERYWAELSDAKFDLTKAQADKLGIESFITGEGPTLPNIKVDKIYLHYLSGTKNSLNNIVINSTELSPANITKKTVDSATVEAAFKKKYGDVPVELVEYEVNTSDAGYFGSNNYDYRLFESGIYKKLGPNFPKVETGWGVYVGNLEDLKRNLKPSKEVLQRLLLNEVGIDAVGIQPNISVVNLKIEDDYLIMTSTLIDPSIDIGAASTEFVKYERSNTGFSVKVPVLNIVADGVTNGKNGKKVVNFKIDKNILLSDIYKPPILGYMNNFAMSILQNGKMLQLKDLPVEETVVVGGFQKADKYKIVSQEEGLTVFNRDIGPNDRNHKIKYGNVSRTLSEYLTGGSKVNNELYCFMVENEGEKVYVLSNEAKHMIPGYYTNLSLLEDVEFDLGDLSLDLLEVPEDLEIDTENLKDKQESIDRVKEGNTDNKWYELIILLVRLVVAYAFLIIFVIYISKLSGLSGALIYELKEYRNLDIYSLLTFGFVHLEDEINIFKVLTVMAGALILWSITGIFV